MADLCDLQSVLTEAYRAAKTFNVLYYIFKTKNNEYYYVSERNIAVERSSRPCIKVFPYGVYASCVDERISNGYTHGRRNY